MYTVLCKKECHFGNLEGDTDTSFKECNKKCIIHYKSDFKKYTKGKISLTKPGTIALRQPFKLESINFIFQFNILKVRHKN